MPGNAAVRIRLVREADEIEFSCGGESRLTGKGGPQTLGAGTFRLHLTDAKKPREQFHVFTKTFKPAETDARDAYVSGWRAKGVPAEVVAMGNRFRTKAGTVLDCRESWISVGRFATEVEAKAMCSRLQRESVWGWVRRQEIEPGTGRAAMIGGDSKGLSVSIPFTVQASAPITVRVAKTHFHGTFTGTIGVGIGRDGSLEAFESLPVEEYLAGVLPAEMPAGWPLEALKAQAVAARSDVLRHVGLKHSLEGFSFTNGEGDRVYAGFGGRQSSTDRAVRETAGVVIVNGGRIVPATFCADCGGSTESNDTVWSAPPDPALRGVSDFADRAAPGSSEASLSAWLKRRAGAYCSNDDEGFRWSRRFTQSELTRLINKAYPVGAVTDVKPGDRGPGGRLKSVRVVGDRRTASVGKEAAIREAFGGLPSALFIIRKQRTSAGSVVFVLEGGGRGHGVGMCQCGARGLALRGADFRKILTHYFSNVVVDTVD